MPPLSIGKRMKANYEKSFDFRLPKRMPVIIRIDGKVFHSFTKGLKRPFDENLISVFNYTAKALCQEIQNCVFAYLQSDEISLLLHNYKNLNSDSWFDNRVQKMVSVSASNATGFFNSVFYKTFSLDKSYPEHILKRIAFFDSKVAVYPEKEVCNYFIWRQIDWQRNSLHMIARSLYSSKELHRKKKAELHDMIHDKGENWDKLPTHLKRGRCIIKDSETNKWVIDNEIPIFTKDRDYIERFLVSAE